MIHLYNYANRIIVNRSFDRVIDKIKPINPDSKSLDLLVMFMEKALNPKKVTTNSIMRDAISKYIAGNINNRELKNVINNINIISNGSLRGRVLLA